MASSYLVIFHSKSSGIENGKESKFSRNEIERNLMHAPFSFCEHNEKVLIYWKANNECLS